MMHGQTNITFKCLIRVWHKGNSKNPNHDKCYNNKLNELHNIQPDPITRSFPGTGKWITYHNNITNGKNSTTKCGLSPLEQSTD
jgi:hypothetical protein